MKQNIKTLIILLAILNTTAFAQFVMPEETSEHEGTWLQWPHHYTYGMFYRNSLDLTWVNMTASLVDSEKVHIVAYNETEKNRIIDLLNDANISLGNIDFFIHQNDDVWVRDNGPVFVYSAENELTILDWGFNGWGGDTPYLKCDIIPTALAADLNMPVIDLSAMVLEGGAIEIDGNGSMMATRSSVTHTSRNPDLTETQVEEYMTTYLGITNFLWLDGVYGIELTDMHIDGFMKFANVSTIITMNTADLLYWEVPQSDIDILFNVTNNNGETYNYIYLPLTQNNVTTAYGNPLDYKGSYCNYYIANTVILVPNYNDPNDDAANAILQSLYPNKTVIGIDVRNLYENGGMIHCVTQQQPVDISTSINKNDKPKMKISKVYPNPGKNNTTFEISLESKSIIVINIYDINTKKVKSTKETPYLPGVHQLRIDTAQLKSGVYIYEILVNGKSVEKNKLIRVRP